MVIDCRIAGPTFNVPLPETEPTEAVMVELPTVSALASPEPLTVATFPEDEIQVARSVTSWVLLSVNVPVAVNC
jgi:hypothetical protein